ncbi:hypothetical protein I6G82_10100 [Lysinibacillus macroides]|uniref:Uncharacterized protein n=1 Tax=Lysinibacillus macroides TaxID=33935 RepID=A0A0M9DI00_9BACI|nr:hypothetical protein [Lysinibacillus macroides]KOY80750.1 hypothetical protein ADM90_16335 [Lysinibacillus macroides]QPR69890.1 hypothetical protein I6G82_10100 [Lysinibacillus macroides]
MEAVNKTKELKAVKDGAEHVSVKTVKASEMQKWMDSRLNALDKPHKYTKILQGISVKEKNSKYYNFERYKSLWKMI